MRYPRLIRRPFWGADSIRCFRKGWELHPRGMDGLKLNGGIDVLLPPPSLSDNKRVFSVKFFCPIFDNFKEAWGDELLIDFRFFFCFFFFYSIIQFSWIVGLIRISFGDLASFFTTAYFSLLLPVEFSSSSSFLSFFASELSSFLFLHDSTRYMYEGGRVGGGGGGDGKKLVVAFLWWNR